MVNRNVVESRLHGALYHKTSPVVRDSETIQEAPATSRDESRVGFAYHGPMRNGTLTSRDDLHDFEWDNQRKDWRRPRLDRAVLKELTGRSTADGILRTLYFVLLLTAAAVVTVLVARVNLWLAIVPLYAYYFLYGFWVALGHELQHKTVFAKSADWLNEALFYVVQTLMWNSPTYARVSHKLHHRYTMIRGYDPETEFPEVITTKWLRAHLLRLIARILVVGAIVDLIRAVARQVRRVAGARDWMIRDHCTDQQRRAIRWESLAIVLAHAVVVAAAIITQIWWLLVFVTIAWQIGSAFEQLWHSTKHLGLPYNVNDHRLNTRSVKVGWFIRSFFWGLDDHVDHHLYPAVPSRNLKRLHGFLAPELRDAESVLFCWKEMFEIARAKDTDPGREFVADLSEADAGDVSDAERLRRGHA
jgi:fatty acid desaturase